MAGPTHATDNRPNHPLFLHFLPASMSGVFATIVTHPLDTVKVRMQLPGPYASDNLYGALRRAARAEGVRGLFRGLSPAMAVTAVSSAARLGLYDPVRATLTARAGLEQPSLGVRIVAAAAVGSVGPLVANPLHLVKIRMQDPGAPRQYRGLGGALAAIARADGVPALWTGTWPSVMRGAMFSASQLATYDQAKGIIKWHLNLEEGLAAHFGAAMTAGVITTTVSTPPDVVKAVVMNSNKPLDSLTCVRQILSTEGVRGLMRGWTANYMRMGPHTLLNMMAFEKLRTLLGMDNL